MKTYEVYKYYDNKRKNKEYEKMIKKINKISFMVMLLIIGLLTLRIIFV